MSRRLQAIAVAFFGLAVAAAVFALRRAGASAKSDFFGVRLGYTANDVRDRFRAPVPGTWQLTSSPEPVLHWTASSPAAVHAATFEIHDGILVAETFELDRAAPEANGPALETTSSTVIARDASNGAVSLRVISRDCPTHEAEVRTLLARGAR